MKQLYALVILCISCYDNTSQNEDVKRYPYWPFEFKWSVIGDLRSKGYNCTLFNEPGQHWTQFWHDNYLCYLDGKNIINPEIVWSIRGPIENMKCTKFWEPADTPDWHDNHICVPIDSPFSFKYSFDGCLRDMDCLSINEPADPNYWFDNYLCHKRTGKFNDTYGTYCHYYSKCTQSKSKTLAVILSNVFALLLGSYLR